MLNNYSIDPVSSGGIGVEQFWLLPQFSGSGFDSDLKCYMSGDCTFSL